jgi:hypothetical protein
LVLLSKHAFIHSISYDIQHCIPRLSDSTELFVNTMDTLGGTKPPQPPTTTAGAEAAAVQAQILEVGKTQKDHATEAVDIGDDGSPTAKKAAASPLKNYFVSARLLSSHHSVDLRH